MNIAISGITGFIGSNLNEYLKNKNHNIIPLYRDIFKVSRQHELEKALSKVDVIINLAGAPINRRWTQLYKKEIIESRVNTTRKIVDTINNLDNKPKLLISASAVGYYSNKECYDEYSQKKAHNFLSDLCQMWESEALKTSKEVRTVITRFGMVLSKKGGALKQMTNTMIFKIAPVIGPGKQFLPWIHLEDLLRAIEYIIDDEDITGTVNIVSPEQNTNKEFMKALGKREKCFMSLTIPSFVFKLVMGETSEFITEGQCVVPKKLLQSEFKFNAPTLQRALDIIYTDKK